MDILCCLDCRSNSLSRQSTQDSDTDSTISVTGPEPIRKSPREYIIPIAVEGGGYVTPRAGSLEPSVSEASTEASRHHYRSSGHFSKPRRMRYWSFIVCNCKWNCTLFPNISATAKNKGYSIAISCYCKTILLLLEALFLLWNGSI